MTLDCSSFRIGKLVVRSGALSWIRRWELHVPHAYRLRVIVGKSDVCAVVVDWGMSMVRRNGLGRGVAWLLAIATTWCAWPAVASEQQTVQTVLAHSLQYFRRVASMQAHSRTDVTYPKGVYQPGEHFYSLYECTFRRSGLFFEDEAARLDLFGRRNWSGPEPGRFEDIRVVVNEGRFLMYQAPNGGKRDRVHMSSKPRTQLLVWISGSKCGLGPVDGYVADMGWNHLCRLALTTPDVALQPDTTVEGRLCHVVKCANSFGDLEFSIDQIDGAITSCKVHKDPHHLCGSIEGQAPWPLEQWKPFGPDNDVVSYDLDLTNVAFSQISGVRVATGWTSTFRVAAKSGREIIEIGKTRRTNITLDPDWDSVDGAFQFEADDGAQVQNLDFPDSGVKLVWKDGNVTLASAAFNAPTALDFPEKPRRLWKLILINGGLVLAVAAIWYFRRSRRPRT